MSKLKRGRGENYLDGESSCAIESFTAFNVRFNDVFGIVGKIDERTLIDRPV